MASRTERELVRDPPGGERRRKFSGGHVEAKVIFIAHVEVELEMS